MSRPPATGPRKWYLEGYLWLVIALPFSAVVGGMITLWYAIESNDGLVVDDYYIRGLHINRVLDRDRAAKRDGLHARLEFDKHAARAAIVLTGNSGFTPPDSITVSFLNATREGYDHVEEFRRGPDGIYRGAPPDLIRGHWYIQIEKQDWRLLQTLTVH